MIACFAGPSFHDANGVGCDPWAPANEGNSVWPKLGSRANPEIIVRRLMSNARPSDFMSAATAMVQCSEQTISAPSVAPGLTDWWHHKDDVLRPHGPVVELDRHAVRRINGAFIPALHPDVTGIIDPCP